jgi:VIT1/CCC1 family predicted Fe2+/Mn2+ transporter
MNECERKPGFMDIVKEGLSYISQIISASIFPPIADGAEMVMKTIENRIIRIEKRILRKISSIIMMGIGGLFLIFALFFFLMEFLGWSSAAAFLSIGIIVFVIGLLLKAGESNR